MRCSPLGRKSRGQIQGRRWRRQTCFGANQQQPAIKLERSAYYPVSRLMCCDRNFGASQLVSKRMLLSENIAASKLQTKAAAEAAAAGKNTDSLWSEHKREISIEGGGRSQSYVKLFLSRFFCDTHTYYTRIRTYTQKHEWEDVKSISSKSGMHAARHSDGTKNRKNCRALD